MTDDKDETIARLTAERDYDRRQSEHLRTVVDRLNAEIVKAEDKLTEDAAQARDEGFAQGIEAAAELHAKIWQEAGAHERERIRALSPTPQADPVREAALGVKRIVEEIDGAIRYGDWHGEWRDEHGVRLKDTPEWVVLCRALAQKGEK